MEPIFSIDPSLSISERDYEEMEVISKGIDAGRKPRKKYRNSNCFVDTRLSYLFPLKPDLDSLSMLAAETPI